MIASILLCSGYGAKTCCCSNEPFGVKTYNFFSFNKFSVSALVAGTFISLTFMVVGVIGVLTIQNSAAGFLICGALLFDGLAGFFWNMGGAGAISSIQQRIQLLMIELSKKNSETPLT